MSAEDKKLGAWSETKWVIQYFANEVKPELEEKTDRKYPVYNAISYRSQLVSGTNYLIKVSISNTNDECVHLKVFQDLPCRGGEISLTGYKTDKTKKDPLEPF